MNSTHFNIINCHLSSYLARNNSSSVLFVFGGSVCRACHCARTPGITMTKPQMVVLSLPSPQRALLWVLVAAAVAFLREGGLLFFVIASCMTIKDFVPLDLVNK